MIYGVINYIYTKDRSSQQLRNMIVMFTSSLGFELSIAVQLQQHRLMEQKTSIDDRDPHGAPHGAEDIYCPGLTLSST